MTDPDLISKMQLWAQDMKKEVDAFVKHALDVEPEMYANRTFKSMQEEFSDQLNLGYATEPQISSEKST